MTRAKIAQAITGVLIGPVALSTVYMRPVIESDKVVGYHARGGNATGTTRTFTLYVLCYTG